MLIRDVCPCAACGWGRDGAVVAKSGGWTGRSGGERAVGQKGTDPFLLQLTTDAGAGK